uniref:Calponin-homology (CH) domain-containing protein n=1 Tax=Timema douglasi TaxID=61478 RepID=A0A7R8VLH9_TIMDO|nr:unnamed protein product [Timema douglasi]
MQLRLERMDISCNRIVSLPVELRTMTSLVYLDLTNNPLLSPTASLCTRGRVHVFKFLELKSLKEDKKRGLLSEDNRRLRHGGMDVPHWELRHKRYTVDSGYSTSDGGLDKKWIRPDSQEEKTEPQMNGNISGSSTPSTISPGENATMVETMILEEQFERKMLDCTVEELKHPYLDQSNEGPTHVHLNGTNTVATLEERKPLEHIQTYREYKEALRQQRSQDVYRPRTSQDTKYHEDSLVNPSDKVNSNNINSKQSCESGSSTNRRPIQKVTPSRNCSTVTFQTPPVSSPLVNGNKSEAGSPPGGLYIKPSSPTKNVIPGSPKLVTATVGYMPPANGLGYRSPKLGSSGRSTMSWSRDVAPDKLSFTMRREFDKAREEAELIEQLRNHIDTRLKMSLPEDMSPALCDGVVLCHLANHVRPRSVASIHVPSPAVPKLTMARCRRNVDNFLEACRRIGVEEVVKPSVACDSPSGALTGPCVLEPTWINLGLRSEYCAGCPQHKGMADSSPSQGHNIDKRWRQFSKVMAISEILLLSNNMYHILVKEEPHRFLNVFYGVVTYYDLDCVSIEDICENLSPQYVIEVYRIVTKKNGQAR